MNFGERWHFNSGRWVTADLHVHSSYSGGSLTPAELLVLGGAQLLAAIGIADHDRVEGAAEGERFAESNPGYPLVIPAQEISLGDHFHLLAIGSREAWGGNNRKQLSEKLKIHHDNGGAVILAHPWTVPKTSWAAGCLRELLNGNVIDGIELFNASLLEFPNGESQLKPVWEELVVPHRLGVTGGSDFHYHRQGRRLGTGRTYLKVSRPGLAGIIEALRERRTVAGMFSYRPFDFGSFGAGYHVLLGNEPWYGELKRMAVGLRNQIKRFPKWNQEKQKILNRLMVGGHYQFVGDLLEG
jgi:predicted metal-dependent phosphoesterase TrpH